MTALIFRRPMNGQPALSYNHWLHDLDIPIVLFTLAHEPEDGAFAHVERFESFEDDKSVESRAIELSERFQFTRIFAQSEHDILRAAQLRQRLGLSGQSIESARAYRDKHYMKSLARASGIETPGFSALNSTSDLYKFVSEHGLPCVVKPRMGAGSRGVRVLQSTTDVEHFLRQLPDSYLVEEFIDAPTFHVDGLATDSRILFSSASQNFNSLLSFQLGVSSGSALLDPAQPLSQLLVAAAQQIISVLPRAPHFAFHAELFLVDAKRAVLCEVACRPGGARTVDAIDAAYGVNLYEQWVRRSFDLPIELPSPRSWFPVGRLLVPPQSGVLQSIPTSIPFDWVLNYRPNCTPGRRYEAPTFSTANIASFLITGRSTDEVMTRMSFLDLWFRNQMRWDEPLVLTA